MANKFHTFNLVAGMIVRNEADRHLRPVLKRISEFCDNIVVVDDRSDDNTIDVCMEYTKNVYRMGEQTFSKDESVLRKALLYHLQEVNPSHVLIIDADELISKEDFEFVVQRLKMEPFYDWYGLQFYHAWKDDPDNDKVYYRDDKLWKPNWGPRLFFWKGSGFIQERKMGCSPTPSYVVESLNGLHVPVKILHLGYLQGKDKTAKFKRYTELDGGRYHNKAHINSIIDEDVVLKEFPIGRAEMFGEIDGN
jgi:glycosyltransferase involved in cell wall biosynthesis